MYIFQSGDHNPINPKGTAILYLEGDIVSFSSPLTSIKDQLPFSPIDEIIIGGVDTNQLNVNQGCGQFRNVIFSAKYFEVNQAMGFILTNFNGKTSVSFIKH